MMAEEHIPNAKTFLKLNLMKKYKTVFIFT